MTSEATSMQAVYWHRCVQVWFDSIYISLILTLIYSLSLNFSLMLILCGWGLCMHDFSRSFPSGGMGSTAVVQQKFTKECFSHWIWWQWLLIQYWLLNLFQMSYIVTIPHTS